MTAEQLIERLVDALGACTDELEGFRPDDRQTIDFADQALKEYHIWCTDKRNE